MIDEIYNALVLLFYINKQGFFNQPIYTANTSRFINIMCCNIHAVTQIQIKLKYL